MVGLIKYHKTCDMLYTHHGDAVKTHDFWLQKNNEDNDDEDEDNHDDEEDIITTNNHFNSCLIKQRHGLVYRTVIQQRQQQQQQQVWGNEYISENVWIVRCRRDSVQNLPSQMGNGN